MVGSQEGRLVTHHASASDFIDLVLADDELLDQEFEALVAGSWGPSPPPAPRVGSDDRSAPGWRSARNRRLPVPTGRIAKVETWRRQRSPP